MSPPPNRPNSGRPGTGRQGRPGTGRQANAQADQAAARTGAADKAGQDPMNRGVLGMAMIAGGLAFAVIGLWLAWDGWVRWDGIADLKTAWSLQISGNESNRKEYAHRAAAALPTEAAAVLMDIDFNAADCDARLEYLVGHCAAKDRTIVVTAQALAAALKGTSPSQDVTPGDGEMLSILAALERGDPPALLPANPKGEAHQSVQFAVYVKQLQTALKVGDTAMIRQAAGMVLLAMPNHPQATVAAMLATICDDHAKTQDLTNAANVVHDQALRYRLCMALADIMPDKADYLHAMSVGAPIVPGSSSLDNEVPQAISIPAANLTLLVHRCLVAGRMDLVNIILPHLPPADSKALSDQLLVATGDLPTLIATRKPEMRPRIVTMAGRHHGLAFQLSNDLGTIPGSKIKVIIGSDEVPADHITQHGTLYTVAPGNSPETGATDVEVHVGDTVIYRGSVNL
jgi:hypothetical protein